MTSCDLAALQLPNGAFASTVTSPRGPMADCNGFTAAQVLRLTRHVPPDAALTAVRARALAYLATCSSPDAPGAFHFWPEAARPAWARHVPADADDTALMLMELLRSGRLDRTAALRGFCQAVLPNRVRGTERAEAPDWIVPGCFFTWIAPPARFGRPAGANVVDCCVNANVIALMASMNASRLPGYGEAVDAIRRAVRWAEHHPKRLSAITPFYPSAVSLVEAIEHAVECGAHDLAELVPSLDAHAAAAVADAGCCRSAFGTTVWHCPAVDAARALARKVSQQRTE